MTASILKQDFSLFNCCLSVVLELEKKGITLKICMLFTVILNKDSF